MKISEILDKTGMQIITGDIEREVTGVYSCDLLSWVISHAQPGDLWVTVMNNTNVVAVATLADVACVVIPEGIEVSDAMLDKARENDVTILTTELSGTQVIIRVNDCLR